MIKQITIGRYADNDVVVNDNRVSGHHCRVYEENGKYYVVDTDSTNGVRVGDVRINAPTEITADSLVVIPTRTFTGAELMELVKTLGESSAKKCLEIEAKYDAIEKRYQNNMSMLCNALYIESYPYTRVFSSPDEEIEYTVKEYDKKIGEAISMLKLISKASQLDVISFHEDLDILAGLAHKASERQKQECQDIRMRVYDKVSRLQKNLCRQVDDVVNKFTAHYQSIFTSHYETASAQDEIWKKVQNEQIISVPYFLYGTQDIEYPLFEQSCVIKYLQFVPFLKRNNLIVRYNSAKLDVAQDIVNGIIGRLFASSKSGNVQLHMVDVKDLGGTSNMLKMLDKHVYTISARTSDVIAELAQLDRYVEDVVQNLLYGPYASLEQYNQGKEKQEPYHVVVFKDFPFGITPEAAHIIQRILVNGSKAGIHFIFMLNEDIVHNSEECEKIAYTIRVDIPQELFAKAIDINSEVDNNANTQNYLKINDKQLHEIVQYVNAGFEMKKDEILRLTDYMIPKEEWWTKHSASRADIPFGMATNKLIQKLNFTQESGQNAAVVIGIPGSGKSVFLHALIASAMVNYSPKELQMYLLDFSGVEFDVYARHHLPHARVIAPEAEREFGLSVLEEVYKEGNRRMTLCRENKVTNIVGLKQKNPDIEIPRLLIVIDEFQKIFEIENDHISKRANKIIHTIIQEYRKFGINLILATQILPAKSVVPYELIANRVVFKSNPNDFSQLIKLPSSATMPRLLTGDCIYNNESGASIANNLTRAFYVDASGDLEELLDEVSAFSKEHKEMTSEVEMRVFRAKEVPYIRLDESFFSVRSVDESFQPEDNPSETSIYIGENIAIQSSDVSIKLEKGTNQNILIVGGKQNIAEELEVCMLFTQSVAYNPQKYFVSFYNFMKRDDEIQGAFEQITRITGYMAQMAEYAYTESEVFDSLTQWKELIESRRSEGCDYPNAFLYFTAFQLGHMFFMNGSRASDCSKLLKYILENGPTVGVFTILQIDSYDSLGKRLEMPLKLFNHRIALQMSEASSTKVVNSSAASKLTDENNPASAHRALYFNENNSSIVKFKPYKLWQLQ